MKISNKIKKIPYAWRIVNGEYEIRVKIWNDGITINTADGHERFEFEKSEPQTVKAIGELLIYASELVKGGEKND